MKNKEDIIRWMSGNGDQERFETLEEAKTFINKEFVEEEDGIHPDIEMLEVVESVMTVSVHKVDDKYHEIKFNESSISSKVRELEAENERLKEQHRNEISDLTQYYQDQIRQLVNNM